MNLPGLKNQSPLALVADDDATVRTIMGQVLEQAGFRVEEASDGRMALERFAECRPDVVLLDVEMPYVDGYTVCQRIRMLDELRDTPIFIMTGRDDPESIQQAYDAGATDFVSKPIAWTTVPHRVRFVLRASAALNEIKGLVRAMPDKIFILNAEGELHSTLEDTRTGQPTVADLVSTGSFVDIFPEDCRDQLKQNVVTALASGQPQISEHTIDDGNTHLETRVVSRDHNTAIAIVRNVTSRKENEDRIYDLAYYDGLTGLPNRQLFQKILDDAILDEAREGGQFAVLFVDLDRFKRINDTLGHSIGDSLLRLVGKRLQKCTANYQSLGSVEVARLGGDEFVVLLRGVRSPDDASAAAKSVVTALSRPMTCEGHRLVVTPSIGITMYPQDGDSSEALLMNADSALYRAKSSGRNTHRFFTDTMRIQSVNRLDLENELREATGAGHFTLHYQPKVDVQTWNVVGLEALIRWQHPERGFISPAEFIPVAEECGLIVPIGAFVVREACRQIASWRNTSLQDIPVSVNVSSEQIYTDELIETVTNALDANSVDAGLLELEITESLLMRDIDSTIACLNEFKELGLKISIDDFGTGYSSLSYLRRFPIDTLKIDRSFVKDLHVDGDDAAICAAILAMARRLNLNVVAEGVEIAEQLEFLRDHGCNQIQGYLYSKPLPADELEQMMEKAHAEISLALVSP
ncbi:MAG: EAL domain-containing protein [Woeseia sp.]